MSALDDVTCQPLDITSAEVERWLTWAGGVERLSESGGVWRGVLAGCDDALAREEARAVPLPAAASVRRRSGGGGG
eukprot:314453-Rhodomonas_salina.1